MELTKDYFDQQVKNLATKDDLDNLKKFVQTNMGTKDGLDDLLEELPTRADFSRLQTSVDGIAKQFREEKEERAANYDRLSRIEAWVKKAPNQIGVDYQA